MYFNEPVKCSNKSNKDTTFEDDTFYCRTQRIYDKTETENPEEACSFEKHQHAREGTFSYALELNSK